MTDEKRRPASSHARDRLLAGVPLTLALLLGGALATTGQDTRFDIIAAEDRRRYSPAVPLASGYRLGHYEIGLQIS